MRRGVWKSFFTFVLVLVLTVGTVATLSTATAAKAETAPARYSQRVREARTASATELSAPVYDDSRPLVSIAAFVLVLAVTGAGCALVLRSRRKEQERRAETRSERPAKRQTQRRSAERRRETRRENRQYVYRTPSIRRI